MITDAVYSGIQALFTFIQSNPEHLMSPTNFTYSKGEVDDHGKKNYKSYLPEEVTAQDDSQIAVFLAGVTALNYYVKSRFNKDITPKEFLQFMTDEEGPELFSSYEITNRLLCSLIEQCLIIDAKRRPSIDKMVDHIYFHQEDLTYKLLENIKKTNGKFKYNKKISSLVNLGKGAFGTVGICLKKPKQKSKSNLRFYVKKQVLVTEGVGKDKMQREIDINKLIRKYNIEGCIKSFEEKEMTNKDGIKIKMEYYPGCEFQELVDKYLIFSENEVREIMTPIAKGLLGLHKYKIVYRDLKPANMLVSYNTSTNKMEANIIDFGTAKDVTKEAAKTLAGSVFTMAPEVHVSAISTKTSPQDYRADIYSFGKIVYILLMGLAIPANITYKKSDYTQEITIPKERKLSIAAINLIETCIQFDPSKRYQSMEDLLADEFFDPASVHSKQSYDEDYTICMQKK